uniref:protein GLUTAMINE DUMPER 6-like n=1 Tax=Erigeron canadensis TaxID=72917 RepID=UPI001CB95C18|nr:protein GLUTAMINE DUMPER 6-like [Erigeron canadensis]
MTPPTPNTPPVSATATAAATGFRWSSPVPYLFGGLAMMLILIACALVILVCSYKKPFSSSQNSSENDTDDHEKQSMPEFRMELAPEMEPKIVIIMPGDLNPTYLAKPVPPANADEQV